MTGQFGWKRMTGLAVVFAAMFWFMWYMQVNNPPFVPGAPPRAPVEWSPFIPHAIITVVVVILIDVVMIVIALWRQKRIHEEAPEMPEALAAGEVTPEAVSPNRLVQGAVKRSARKARKSAPARAAAAPTATATMEAEPPEARRKPAKRKPAKKKPSSRKTKKGKRK